MSNILPIFCDVDDTLEELLFVKEDIEELPDHASDSEAGGDSDEDCISTSDETFSFSGLVLVQTPPADVLYCSTSIETRQTKQNQKKKRKTTEKIVVQPPKKTKSSTRKSSKVQDQTLSSLPDFDCSDDSDGNAAVNEKDDNDVNSDWTATVPFFFFNLYQTLKNQLLQQFAMHVVIQQFLEKFLNGFLIRILYNL